MKESSMLGAAVAAVSHSDIGKGGLAQVLEFG